LVAGGRVPAYARLALAFTEDPQAAQSQYAFLLELFDYQGGELVEQPLGLLFLDTHFPRQVCGQLCLCHLFVTSST
jgi:hypothetical protein